MYAKMFGQSHNFHVAVTFLLFYKDPTISRLNISSDMKRCAQESLVLADNHFQLEQHAPV